MKYIITAISLYYIFTASIPLNIAILLVVLVAVIWFLASELQSSGEKLLRQAEDINTLVEQGANGSNSLAKSMHAVGAHTISLELEKKTRTKY